MNSDTEDQLYDVEKILDYDENTHKFLVRWTGYEGNDSWESVQNLSCPILISQFFYELLLEKRCKDKSSQTNKSGQSGNESFIQIFKKGWPKNVAQNHKNYDAFIDIPYKIESIDNQSKVAKILQTDQSDPITVPIDWLINNFPSLVNQYYLDKPESKAHV